MLIFKMFRVFVMILFFLSATFFSKSQSNCIEFENGWTLYENGKHEEAYALFSEQIKLLKEKKKDSLCLAEVLWGAGMIAFENKNIKEAELYYEGAANIFHILRADNHPGYLSSLYYSGLLNIANENFKLAELNYLEALRVAKATLEEDNPFRGILLFGMALLYTQKKEYHVAEDYYLESLRLQKKVFGVNNETYATTLISLGGMYFDSQEYEKAESYYLLGLDLRKKILGETHLNYISTLGSLANTYNALNDFSKSETYHLEILRLLKKSQSENHPDYIRATLSLAIFYQEAGNYGKAEQYYLSGLQIQSRALDKDSLEYAEFLSGIAGLYLVLNDFTKAEHYLLQALEIENRKFDHELQRKAIIINNAGNLYFSMKDYSKAEQFYIEALELQKKDSSNSPYGYNASLNSLATFYYTKGEFIKAEAFYKEALSRQKSINEDNLDYAKPLINLARIYTKNNEYQKAEELLIKAISIQEKILNDKNGIKVDILRNAGGFYSITQKDSLALYYYSKMFQFQNEMVLTNQESLSNWKLSFFLWRRFNENSFFNSIYYFQSNYNLILSEARKIEYDNELFVKNFLLHNRQFMNKAVQLSKDTVISKLQKELTLLKVKLYNLSLQSIKENNQIVNLSEKIEKNETELIQKLTEGGGRLNLKIPNWKEVQGALQTSEVAIEFISFPYNNRQYWSDSVLYCALIVKPGYSEPKLVYLFEKNQLSFALKKEGNILDQSYVNILYQHTKSDNLLYKLIWKPLESLLQGVTTVYVGSTGLLNNIALGAIPINDAYTVGSKYGLQIVGTTADIIDKKEIFIDKKSVQQAIIFGGINYDIASSKPIDFNSNNENNVYAYVPTDSTRGASGKWNYLGGTFKEAKAIASELKDQKITTRFYSDSIATETLFKNMSVTSSTIIHIATHGYFFPDIERKKDDGMQLINEEKQTAFKVSENPLLRSGLIFAGANPTWTNPDYVNTATDDGILTAYEISNMDLSNVKLVVLSACETGLGDIKGSEGVFGLQRAFKLAGVKNIIMSLWKVPDEKTRELMLSFYQFCFDGKSIGDAFKSAQEMMRTKYPASPYYWAGFTLLQ